MKQTYKLLIPLLPIVCIVGSILNVNIASSAPDTTLKVDPQMVYALPGESFTVDIKVAEVERLHEWQANISFNPSVLKFVNVTEGDFLKQGGRETAGFSYLNNVTDGWALFSWAIVGKYSEDGSGTLATVEFQVLTTGESPIELRIVPLWTDKNGDGVVDVYKHDEPYVTEMGFNKSWTSMRVVQDTKNAELMFPTHLLKMNPAPVPPGGAEQELLAFTLTNGIFLNLMLPPVAMFTYSPKPPSFNETVTFDASLSYTTPPRNIIEYHWDFDDGTTANETGSTVEHIYTSGGMYNVTLTVIDNANATTLVKAMYNTTRMPKIWYELYSSNTTTIEVKLAHDIAITNVKVSQEKVAAGETVTINVTALNKGINTESFNVTAYYGDNLIDKESVTALDAGAEESIIFNWDTTGVAEGSYPIRAEATDVAGEGNPQDNVFTDGTVTVGPTQQMFPTTLVIGAVIAVAIIGIVAFVFLRRRRASSA